MRTLDMIIKLFWSLFAKHIQRLEFGPNEGLVARVLSCAKSRSVMLAHVQGVVLGVGSDEYFEFGW